MRRLIGAILASIVLIVGMLLFVNFLANGGAQMFMDAGQAVAPAFQLHLPATPDELGGQ